MRFLSLATAAGLTLALGGCGPQPQPPMPTPSPTTTPFFASDEEALAAAEEVYREYEVAVDHLLIGDQVAELQELATGGALDSAIESLEAFVDAGRVQTGFSQVEIHGPSSVAPGFETVQLYACLDVSDVMVFASDGTSLTSPDRPTRFPMIVDLIFEDSIGRYLVAEEAVWDGGDFCE